VKTLSLRGEAFIKGFEELRLTAYRKFPGEPWTCGYGHTGRDVTNGTTCDAAQAATWFKCDVAAPERAVNLMVAVPLTQNQFDALVSFAFNVGIAAEAHSTMLRKVNALDYEGAAAEFVKWDHVNGVEVPGLKRRREAERDLFNTPEAA